MVSVRIRVSVRGRFMGSLVLGSFIINIRASPLKFISSILH